MLQQVRYSNSRSDTNWLKMAKSKWYGRQATLRCATSRHAWLLASGWLSDLFSYLDNTSFVPSDRIDGIA